LPWDWLPHPASPEYEMLLIAAEEYHAGWAALEAHNAALRAAAQPQPTPRRKPGADGCVLPGMNGASPSPPEASPSAGDAS
jgi:hypothetical protein